MLRIHGEELVNLRLVLLWIELKLRRNDSNQL